MSNHYFIGIKVSRSIMEHLVDWQSNLKEKMNYKVWTDPEDFHITLKFLGGCSDEKIDAYLKALLSQSWPEAFSVRVGPAGSFGHPDQPRVFHAEVEKAAPLLEIKRQVEEVGQTLGFQTEQRVYHPHVTLAKRQAQGTSPLSLAENDEWFKAQYEMVIQQFSVFKIHPRSIPKYEKIAEVRLDER